MPSSETTTTAEVELDGDHTSTVASRRARAAARRLRNSIAGLRGTKTSIARARDWLPLCDTEVELRLELRKLFEIERRLIAIVRRLEDDHRCAVRSPTTNPESE